jgi:7-cyano-7-deazaguanine synthase in queuosine biosynthesis
MLQDFIVFTLLFAAIFYSICHIFSTFASKKETQCGNCPSCNLKKELLHKRDC